MSTPTCVAICFRLITFFVCIKAAIISLNIYYTCIIYMTIYMTIYDNILFESKKVFNVYANMCCNFVSNELFFCTHKRRHLLYMQICIYDNVVSQFDNYNFTNLMKMYLFHTFSLKSYNSTNVHGNRVNLHVHVHHDIT